MFEVARSGDEMLKLVHLNVKTHFSAEFQSFALCVRFLDSSCELVNLLSNVGPCGFSE